MNAGFLHLRPAAFGGRVVDHGYRSLGTWQGVRPQLQDMGSQRGPRHHDTVLPFRGQQVDSLSIN
jgi:hypothetical protein